MLNDEQVQNRTIFCKDNLKILQGLNSESIDLIYLDPPFNKNKTFAAPIGSAAEGAEFSDIFREDDAKQRWIDAIEEDYTSIHKLLTTVKELNGLEAKGTSSHYLYNYCYLTYMAIRLIEMKRVLKETGSLYLHCDPTMSHYLKILMDIIFGEKNFRNEIVWCYSRPSAPRQRQLSRVHDLVYWYSKGREWKFNPEVIRQRYAESSLAREGYVAAKSKMTAGTPVELSKGGKFPESWIYIPLLKGNSREYVGYPTQKPLALLERIIKASCPERGVVLDPFCGCATTCVAAEKLGRKWIGVDVSHKAYELVKVRLEREVSANLKETSNGKKIIHPEAMLNWDKEIHFKTDAPRRTDLGVDNREKKYIYVFSNAEAYPGEYKVGVSKNPEQRLKQNQTFSANRGLKEEYRLLTPYFLEIENRVHETFPRRNDKHEWVQSPLGEIVRHIEQCRDEMQEED